MVLRLIKKNGITAKMTATAKYHRGTWETTHVYTLARDGETWLIMEKDHY
jgi:hypothetical protein